MTYRTFKVLYAPQLSRYIRGGNLVGIELLYQQVTGKSNCPMLSKHLLIPSNRPNYKIILTDGSTHKIQCTCRKYGGILRSNIGKFIFSTERI